MLARRLSVRSLCIRVQCRIFGQVEFVDDLPDKTLRTENVYFSLYRCATEIRTFHAGIGFQQTAIFCLKYES